MQMFDFASISLTWTKLIWKIIIRLETLLDSIFISNSRLDAVDFKRSFKARKIYFPIDVRRMVNVRASCARVRTPGRLNLMQHCKRFSTASKLCK